MKLTVYHDGQFWMGVLEEDSGSGLRAARHRFGAEPKSEELLQWICEGKLSLKEDAASRVLPERPERRANPKRLQRLVAGEMKRPGISSKARQALNRELERHKLEKRVQSREQREEETKRKRELRVHKAKEKHRGH